MVLEGAILQNSFTSVYHKPVFGLYAPAFQYGVFRIEAVWADLMPANNSRSSAVSAATGPKKSTN